MDDKLMYIHNEFDDNRQNYPFCRFKLMIETFGNPNLYQVHKLMRVYFKNFGYNLQSNIPPSLSLIIKKIGCC